MKIAIKIKDGLNLAELTQLIKDHIDVEVVTVNPEYVFTFGGDGTFLDAVSHYGKNPVYIPINMGTLGFYCSWSVAKFEEVLRDLAENNIIQAPTLDIVVLRKNGAKQIYNCLNEATIINAINTQIVTILIDDFEIEKFRGTGICISTPTGSTAYNKSLGGSIISPQKKLFQLTHIAAINNVKYRNIGNSVILNEMEKLSFISEESHFANSVLSVDRKTYHVRNVNRIDVTFSQTTIKILVPYNNNFYQRVRDAFIN